ncbi:MIP/aquaporin family protein [Streptomyces alkaliterrae]|uniref:Aquaporin family protein n=1 Tax=Streptomyces alkaliterrae TaxID=2213162 RepID=A0A5P0YRC0_9ACTN|nr:MIP/aquaporin family protein [Streptomyces alkaliterrae]MBB1258234.1 aquaporin family protein [Streptomyces alkaliterrae]MQS02864.1 aquaporin family protein [Streptomyces alkaliterrae]
MSTSDIFLGEVIGTAVLILLGGGVVAGVVLKHSKAFNAGWVAITFGWGFAVLTGAYISSNLSGAHLNPAVTVGIAMKENAWDKVPYYFAGQLIGAMLGAFLMWVCYKDHFRAHLTETAEETAEEKVAVAVGADGSDEVAANAGPKAPGPRGVEDPGPVLGIFSTGPAIRNPLSNILTETIATTVLVLAILALGLTEGLAVSGTGILIVALVVVGLGLSLGGPTGYAINPARDLGPRIVHALLPLPNKGGSDWGYAWIPVVGPLLGGVIAGGIYQLAFA